MPAGPEAKFQAKIVSYLKKKGCVVLKYEQNATTHSGFPDILFMESGFWGAIEVKKSKNAKFQPLQKEMIEKLDKMSWARVVYPENWEEVKKEIEEIL